jgi:predicted nuclease of predicted toxin-antitoxin system
MKILFDQGTPVPLRRLLPEHTITTVAECGWATWQNGQLLAAAEEAQYEVFVTTDQNLRYQQPVTGRRLAIVVLTSTSWPKIQGHIATIRTVLAQTTVGSYQEIEITP